MNKLMKFFKDEQGATAVEYAIMVALIAVAVITTVRLVGTETSTTFSTVASALVGVTP